MKKGLEPWDLVMFPLSKCLKVLSINLDFNVFAFPPNQMKAKHLALEKSEP